MTATAAARGLTRALVCVLVVLTARFAGEKLVEAIAPNENMAHNPYIPIVTLLSERIDYEQPIQKSYMHQGYSFNYIVNEEGLCFMVSGRSFGCVFFFLPFVFFLLGAAACFPATGN